MKIETNRLIIRSLRESDTPEYAAIVSDPEVTRFLGDGLPYTYEQATEYLYACFNSEVKEGFTRYAVVLRETRELIGFCGFKRLSDCVDFGWRYAKRAWGKGYATEAAAAVLDYGIKTLKLDDIVAEAVIENIRSIRVIEKIGMQFEDFGEVQGRKTVRYKQPSGS